MHGVILLCIFLVVCLANAKDLDTAAPERMLDEGGLCRSSCDTFWRRGGTTHDIKCTKYKGDCQFGKVITSSGYPSQPFPLKKLLYKFTDAENNVRLALNISWRPARDSSIDKITGYELEIAKPGMGDSVCFSLGTTMTTQNYADCLHAEEDCGNEFFYDCFGKENGYEVIPGETHSIFINSVPMSPDVVKSPDHGTLFNVDIPACDTMEMKDVVHCASWKMSLSVDEIFCANRSLRYSYSLDGGYQPPAVVKFCEGSATQCLHKVSSGEQQHERMTGFDYFSLPSFADLSIPYVITLHGKESIERKLIPVNFTYCIPPPNADSTNDPVVVGVLVACIGFLIIFLFVLLWRYRDRFDFLKKLFHCLRSETSEPKEETTENGVIYGEQNAPLNGGVSQTRPMAQPHPVPVVTLPVPQIEPLVTTPDLPSKPPRVYVVFAEDHDLHKDVVHWFCSYLKADLNMDVKMSMWDSIDAAANPLMYMKHNLKHADKVIIICSAGTRKCLEKPEWDGDMFTPVVRNIIQESFVGKNPGKFLVAYFNYSDQKDVPEYLYDQTQMYWSLYKIMKQFEQFYFRLSGIEQYHEGGIRRIEKIAFDRYYDPALSSCGRKLKEAIDAMTKFCEENPTWFTDQKGEDIASTCLPPAPSEGEQSLIPPSDEFETKASITTLEISRPDEIPPPEVSGARRKVPVPVLPKEQMPTIDESAVPEDTTPHKDSMDEESFMISEVDSLSSDVKSTPKTQRLEPMEHDEISKDTINVPHRPAPTEHEVELTPDSGYIPSFHPESFGDLIKDSIHEHSEDDSLENQRLSPSPKQPKIFYIGRPDHLELNGLPEADVHMTGGMPNNYEDNHQHEMYGEPPNFSVTLADVDEHDVDFEDEFKSINLSVQI